MLTTGEVQVRRFLQVGDGWGECVLNYKGVWTLHVEHSGRREMERVGIDYAG